jgi:hypothetical protein
MNKPFPRQSANIGILQAHVAELVEAGVAISEIKRRGAEAGWTPQGINGALRLLGIRQRNTRSDAGIQKYPLVARDEATRILAHFKDRNEALHFLDHVRSLL